MFASAGNRLHPIIIDTMIYGMVEMLQNSQPVAALRIRNNVYREVSMAAQSLTIRIRSVRI